MRALVTRITERLFQHEDMNVGDMEFVYINIERSQNIFSLIKTMETLVIPFDVRNVDSRILKSHAEAVSVATNESKIIESSRLK